MKKRAQLFSINVFSAMIILLCLLITIIQPVNAWFSSEHNNGVEISVTVGNLNLKVYQDSVEIKTDTANVSVEEKSYIQLSQKIMPDTFVPLNLSLTNEDEGTVGLYIKFKFEIFRRGYTADFPVDVRITAGENFEEDSEGYYLYTKGTGSSEEFAKDANVTLLSGFKILVSEFVDETGNMIIKNSDTILIKLTVEGSTIPY